MTMPLKMFHYLEKLDDLKGLDWSKLILEQLFRNMDSVYHSVRRRERIGDRVGEYIHGCVFVLNVFLWECSNLFPLTSVSNMVIFKRCEGSTKRGNHTISSLSDDEVSMCPFAYTSDGPSQEVSNRRLFQPTLMEFIHCTRIRKQQSILRKCREDLAVRKTSYTEFPIETLIGKGPNGRDPIISDVQLDVSTSVDLCTPSPTLSFDSGEDNPMNELFNCIERNEKLECQKSHVLDKENPIIDSPVILQGLELYEYMLVEPCQNLEIRSDVVCTDDTSLVTPPPQKMDISHNLQTSELAIGDIEDTIEATKPLISSPHSMGKSEYDHVLKSSTNQSTCPPSFELLDQSDMDVCDKSQPSFVSKSPLRLMTNSRPKSSTPYTYSKSNLIFVVEEGQSMYNQLANDVRYSKICIMRHDGIAYTQLHLNKDYMSPEKTIEMINDLRTPLLNVGNPQSNSIFISSPDFWASAAASADALENAVSPLNCLKGEDLFDVVRRINFSPSDITSPDSPYVSSMIKRVKDRNAEKVSNKKKKERELYLIATNIGQLVPKLNEETKRLVMKPE